MKKLSFLKSLIATVNSKSLDISLSMMALFVVSLVVISIFQLSEAVLYLLAYGSIASVAIFVLIVTYMVYPINKDA